MKKYNICFLVVGLCMSFVALFPLKAQEKKYAMFSVAFYNQENLFDTIHDVVTRDVAGKLDTVRHKNDYEYLPDGANRWGSMKYNAKLKNMSEVIAQLGTGGRNAIYPAVIGLSEVENLRVLEDLCRQPALASRGYEIVHVEGPDRRGVDCAFLYNPQLFKLSGYKLHPYIYENSDTTYLTRGFLVATGTLAGETFHFIVNHWPSRAAASEARERGGVQVRAIKDSLMQADPDCHVVIMGDMNDDPDDKSMAVSLGAKRKQKDCGASDLWNPFWDMLRKEGIGSLKYNGKWNLFDQIVFSGNLLGSDRSTWTYHRSEVFSRDYLLQQEGKYKGYPKRTHAGGVWLNGYSDHLPTLVYFVKELK